MTEYLLEIKGLRKVFGDIAALADGQLNLRPGSIHALCGGNGAGKSTFLNILMGLISPTEGTMVVDGAPYEGRSPATALAVGIAMITQELSLAEHLSVSENIFLGREPLRYGVIDYRRMHTDAQALMDRLQFPIDVRKRVSELSIARRQLVEIAKAISYNSRILIMDEPTSALGELETQVLFQSIRRLKDQGVGIIYVSHRMSEIFQIADEYTVFRDGRFIESGQIANIDLPRLVRLIVGRDVQRRDRGADATAAAEILAVHSLSRPGEFQDISLAVHKGEVLGIYGLVGAGRSEFLQAIYGLTRPHSGEIFIDGKRTSINSPIDALRNRISLVTEDRQESGLVGCRPVRENISLASLPAVSPRGLMRHAREREAVKRMIGLLGIRLASPEQRADSLSGGNQQKVVFSRVLLTEPRILLCDEPTRGIDEGAKQQIYDLISNFVGHERGAIVVSSELEEIFRVSDRIAVFRRGRLAGILSRQEATHAALAHLAS